MDKPNIDNLVAKETLMIGFLSFILLIGTFLRKLNQKYGVHKYFQYLILGSIYSHTFFDRNCYRILLL